MANKKLKIFYHVCSLPSWQDIMSDQLTKLYESGLLHAAEEIHICTIGNQKELDVAKSVTKDFDNIQWHHISDRLDLMEYATLDYIREYVHKNQEEYYVLYMHQKGITRPTDKNTADWRHYLDYWSIERWKLSIEKLDQGHDLVGTNWIDGYETKQDDKGNSIAVWPHFSGGTWWANSQYLRTLEPMVHPDSVPYGETSKLTKLEYTKVNWRYDHEAWHGSASPKIFCLHESPGKTAYPGWHFDHAYPRSMYAPLPSNQVTEGVTHTPSPYLDLHMTRILVDRRKALGDVLMITPVLHELRQRYGKLAFIQVVTEETIALHNNPDINSVVKPSEMKKEDPWDVYINLNDAYELNPLCNYIDAYLARAFGRPELFGNIDRTIRLHPTSAEVDRVKKIIAEQIKSKYIVVHMRRWAWENKNIDPHIWGSFFTFMNHHYPDVKIVSVGAQYDYKVTEVMNGVDLVDKLTIGEICALMSMSQCFVGGDSGPYHIASASTVPIVALLSHMRPGQILPWRAGEFGHKVTVVQSDVPCVGCYARQNPPVRNLTCEGEEQWICAKKFNPESIFNAVKNYIT